MTTSTDNILSIETMGGERFNYQIGEKVDPHLVLAQSYLTEFFEANKDIFIGKSLRYPVGNANAVRFMGVPDNFQSYANRDSDRVIEFLYSAKIVVPESFQYSVINVTIITVNSNVADVFYEYLPEAGDEIIFFENFPQINKQISSFNRLITQVYPTNKEFLQVYSGYKILSNKDFKLSEIILNKRFRYGKDNQNQIIDINKVLYKFDIENNQQLSQKEKFHYYNFKVLQHHSKGFKEIFDVTNGVSESLALYAENPEQYHTLLRMIDI